jgi:hypothetical protein
MENSNVKYQSEQTVKSSKEYEAPKMNEDANSKNEKLQIDKSNNSDGRNAENGEDNGFFNEEKQAEENAERNQREMNQ